MQTIIKDLVNSLQQNNTSLVEHLNTHSSYTWQENYPIAVVHEQKRVKEADILKKLDDLFFFGDDGFSQDMHTPKMIEILKEQAPNYIKTASLLCFDGEKEHAVTMQEKFTHDKWKKVLNTQNFKATIEISSFDSTASDIAIETELRDFMRSRKEIPSLKQIGFVWIVSIPNTLNIDKTITHYFNDTYKKIIYQNTITYIAWNAKLNGINLRYFAYKITKDNV